MNVYEDYANYLKELTPFIETLRKNDSPSLLAITDVLLVTDHIYQKYIEGEKIDDDMDEIFSLGFGYLSNILTDFKTYYEDYFDKNMETFNYYSMLMIENVFLDDFKSNLEVDEYLTDERREAIEAMLFKVDGILANRKPLKENEIEEIEKLIEELTPVEFTFQPVYVVFSMIAEELQLY